jgi:zinc-binding alcohol dehydrogenase/oxidoreductase
MRAAVLTSPNQLLDYQEVSTPKPRRGEVLVTLKCSALNHRDLWITLGQYAGIKYPTILGSDGSGTVDSQPVIINPSIQWGSNPRVQGSSYRILGLPDNGTLAEAVVVPRSNIVPMPAHLSFEQAAALPLAGLTAWRALFSRCQLKRGEQVLITGIGGGVALLALQFAIAAGAEVWVTSGTDDKIQRAMALGAKGGANYKQDGWDKQLRLVAGGGFHVIIDSAAGDDFARLAGLCEPGGRIGIYGGTAGKINQLSPQVIFWKQISIHGSTMGSSTDFTRMVKFVNQYQITPIVDRVYPLSAVNDALLHMKDGAQMGKIVLQCGA